MREALEALNRLSGPDCRIASYDGWSLLLHSGMSVEYAKPLAKFSGVSYLSCPMEFSHPAFRLASDTERKAVAVITPLESQDFLVAIEAETMSGMNRHVFFIAANSVEVRAGA